MSILSDLNGPFRYGEKIKCRCDQCGVEFSLKGGLRKRILEKRITLKHNGAEGRFCSNRCCGLSKITKVTVSCTQCGVTFNRVKSKTVGRKTIFCSRSCAARHGIYHRSTGSSRSKLEIWLEAQLRSLYPALDFEFNKRSLSISELDIVIPSLNLAFEINGAFHYEPICGQEKLLKTQKSDLRKSQACIKEGIELHVIDSSKQGDFRVSTSIKFLEKIKKVIARKLNDTV